LTQSIKDLDQQVAQATATRQEEHAEYVEALSANNAAAELLSIAKTRLNKFYNPALVSLVQTQTEAPQEQPQAPDGAADTVSLLDSFNDASFHANSQ